MKIENEVVQEWKRFLQSDEYIHASECGTLLIAQHFAEWGRMNPSRTPRVEVSNPLMQL